MKELSELLNNHRRITKRYNEDNTTAYKYACVCNPEDGIAPDDWAGHEMGISFTKAGAHFQTKKERQYDCNCIFGVGRHGPLR